jgi:hypothetical protein
MRAACRAIMCRVTAGQVQHESAALGALGAAVGFAAGRHGVLRSPQPPAALAGPRHGLTLTGDRQKHLDARACRGGDRGADDIVNAMYGTRALSSVKSLCLFTSFRDSVRWLVFAHSDRERRESVARASPARPGQGLRRERPYRDLRRAGVAQNKRGDLEL